MDRPKRPVGHPTDYKPEYCEKLIEHMAQGYSFETFGAIADVHLGTLYEWTRKHPEFHEAKRSGTIKSRMFWEKAGHVGLFKKKGAPEINSTIWVFSMKNRFGWADSPAPTEEDAEETYQPPQELLDASKTS